jgi:hypothetical protein
MIKIECDFYFVVRSVCIEFRVELFYMYSIKTTGSLKFEI